MVDRLLGGKYAIAEKLGQGGMGTVYRATHVALHRDEAIKELSPSFSHDPAFLQRFLREARAMARLDHENIIRVHDVFDDNDRHYIAMEFFAGKSLKDVITEAGPIGADAAISIIKQAASGLAYSHQRGVIHRDIKPSNLMLNSAGKVKIADFGVASAQDEASMTYTGQLVGSPRYMSPEQARGESPDARSDLYSLGMVFYELLTASTPFDGDSGIAVIGKIAYREQELELRFPQTVPPHLRDIVTKLLRRDAAQRFQSAHELLAELALDRIELPSPAPAATVLEETVVARRADVSAPAPVVEREPTESGQFVLPSDVSDKTVLQRPVAPVTAGSVPIVEDIDIEPLESAFEDVNRTIADQQHGSESQAKEDTHSFGNQGIAGSASRRHSNATKHSIPSNDEMLIEADMQVGDVSLETLRHMRGKRTVQVTEKGSTSDEQRRTSRIAVAAVSLIAIVGGGVILYSQFSGGPPTTSNSDASSVVTDEAALPAQSPVAASAGTIQSASVQPIAAPAATPAPPQVVATKPTIPPPVNTTNSGTAATEVTGQPLPAEDPTAQATAMDLAQRLSREQALLTDAIAKADEAEAASYAPTYYSLGKKYEQRLTELVQTSDGQRQKSDYVGMKSTLRDALNTAQQATVFFSRAGKDAAGGKASAEQFASRYTAAANLLHTLDTIRAEVDALDGKTGVPYSYRDATDAYAQGKDFLSIADRFLKQHQYTDAAAALQKAESHLNAASGFFETTKQKAIEAASADAASPQ